MKNAKAVIPKIKIQDAIKQIIDTNKDEYKYNCEDKAVEHLYIYIYK